MAGLGDSKQSNEINDPEYLTLKVDRLVQDSLRSKIREYRSWISALGVVIVSLVGYQIFDIKTEFKKLDDKLARSESMIGALELRAKVFQDSTRSFLDNTRTHADDFRNSLDATIKSSSTFATNMVMAQVSSIDGLRIRLLTIIDQNEKLQGAVDAKIIEASKQILLMEQLKTGLEKQAETIRKMASKTYVFVERGRKKDDAEPGTDNRYRKKETQLGLTQNTLKVVFHQIPDDWSAAMEPVAHVDVYVDGVLKMEEWFKEGDQKTIPGTSFKIEAVLIYIAYSNYPGSSYLPDFVVFKIYE